MNIGAVRSYILKEFIRKIGIRIEKKEVLYLLVIVIGEGILGTKLISETTVLIEITI